MRTKHSDCDRCAELLPWLLNGSLDTLARDRVMAHLACCRACREELAETAAGWEIFTTHAGSHDLALVAHGLAPESASQALIDSHLALCGSCREELRIARLAVAMVEADDDLAHARSGVSETAGLRRRWPAVWSPPSLFRIAAALILSVALGFWLGGRWLDRQAIPVRPLHLSAGKPAPPVTAPAIFADGFESGQPTGWMMAAESLSEPAETKERLAARAARLRGPRNN